MPILNVCSLFWARGLILHLWPSAANWQCVNVSGVYYERRRAFSDDPDPFS